MKVGRVENLDRLSLASLRLNSMTSVAVTTSAGREFHGWTTRLEKTYLAELVLTSGMDKRKECPLVVRGEELSKFKCTVTMDDVKACC